MSPEELKLLQAKATAFDNILDILWPLDDAEGQWEVDTIEHVGDEVLTVYPNAHRGDRTISKDIL